MNITSSLKTQGPLASSPKKASKPTNCESPSCQTDVFEPSQSSFGPRVLGGFVGAVVGGLAGSVSPNAAAVASGLGAGVATTASFGSKLSDVVQSGKNGELLNDVALTTGAVFAGGITLTSFSAAAGMGALALDHALPGAGRLVSAAMGAAAGASLGIWN